MAAFRAYAKFGKDGVINAVLCVDKPLQVELIWVLHSRPPFGAVIFKLVCEIDAVQREGSRCCNRLTTTLR
jgi:hypothetical protein